MSHAATLRIGKQLGELLSDLHKSGATHGRLSPGAVSVSDRRAIWLDPSESPVVADGSIFAPPSSESTATGAAIQRDIYGFGATLTALSLGRLPSQLADGALDIYGRTVHLGLANVLDAATAPDPLDRFESVDEILEELDRLASLAVTRSSATATATANSVNAGSAGSADSLDSLVAEPDPVEVPWTLVDPGSGSSRRSRWTAFTWPTGRDLAQRPWAIAGALVAMAAVVVVVVNPGRHLIVDEREARPLPGGGALAAVAQPLTKSQPLAMTRAADATDSSGSLIDRAVVDPGAVPTRLTSGDASGGPAPLIGASTEGGPATKPTPKPAAAPEAVVPVAPSASPPAPAPAVGAASSPLPKAVSTVAPVPQPVPPVVQQTVPPTIPRTVPATQPPPPPPPPAPTPPTTVDAVVRPGTPPAGPPTTVDAVVRPGSHPAGPQVTVDAVVRPGSAPAGPPTTVDAVRRP